MGAIIDFFESIGNLFSTLFDFVIGFFKDIAYIIKLTGEFVLNIPSYFSWLPSELLALIVTAFGIVVIYKILGREG